MARTKVSKRINDNPEPTKRGRKTTGKMAKKSQDNKRGRKSTGNKSKQSRSKSPKSISSRSRSPKSESSKSRSSRSRSPKTLNKNRRSRKMNKEYELLSYGYFDRYVNNFLEDNDMNEMQKSSDFVNELQNYVELKYQNLITRSLRITLSDSKRKTLLPRDIETFVKITDFQGAKGANRSLFLVRPDYKYSTFDINGSKFNSPNLDITKSSIKKAVTNAGLLSRVSGECYTVVNYLIIDLINLILGHSVISLEQRKAKRLDLNDLNHAKEYIKNNMECY